MVDVDAQIRAVSRSIGIEQTEGEELRLQRIAQTYPSQIDDVWNAVTSPERIARWFAPVEGDAVLGGRYQIVGNAGGEVLACSPPADGSAGYRLSWEMGGAVSWVEVALTTDGDSTRLELVHAARPGDVPPGFWELYGPGATGVGWDGALLGLALHLRSDTSVTPGTAEAWSLSEEGMRFSRRAADAWAEAHMADGADPEAATAAAEATYRFYTGQPAPASPDA
jgi:uncharacterized protein YndB with AHSA1/START domain